MARIEGVPAARAGVMQRLVYWLARRMLGKVPEPLTIQAHSAWIFRAYGGYEWALSHANQVPARTKALASMKVATLIGCPF